MNKLKQFIARLAFKRIMERIRIQRFIRTASINKDSILAQYIKFLDADNREESMFYYNAFITTAFFKTYQETFSEKEFMSRNAKIAYPTFFKRKAIPCLEYTENFPECPVCKRKIARIDTLTDETDDKDYEQRAYKAYWNDSGILEVQCPAGHKLYLDAKTRKIAERQEEKPIDKVVENIKTGKGKIPGIHKIHSMWAE